MGDEKIKQVKKTLWRIVFAKAAIGRVMDACDYIATNNLKPNSPIYYQLVTAIFVLYARPFGDNGGVGKISSQFARYDSADKNNLHGLMIHGRHKFYAHLDADTRLYDENAKQPIGHLFGMSIMADDMGDDTIELHTRIIEPQLTLETIPRIKSLAKDLLKALCLEENTQLKRLDESGYRFKLGKNEIYYE